jgi:hypothetical protein
MLMLAFDRPDDARFETLRRELIARSYGEIEADMAGIGVPILGSDGALRGVLTVSGPSIRFTPSAVNRIEDALCSAAQEQTVRIGGDGGRFERVRRVGGGSGGGEMLIRCQRFPRLNQ